MGKIIKNGIEYSGGGGSSTPTKTINALRKRLKLSIGDLRWEDGEADTSVNTKAYTEDFIPVDKTEVEIETNSIYVGLRCYDEDLGYLGFVDLGGKLLKGTSIFTLTEGTKYISLTLAFSEKTGGITLTEGMLEEHEIRIDNDIYITTCHAGTEQDRWTLIWKDDFDTFDENVWTREDREPSNNELEYWSSSEDNSFVKDGKLIIRALKKDTVVGDKTYHYTSSEINTRGKKSFIYGRFEARIKIPQIAGSWPAFWCLGESTTTRPNWPICGEIDIFEQVNTNDYYNVALHYSNSTTNDSNKSNHKMVNNSNSGSGLSGWHTYGVIWNKDDFTFYMDDIKNIICVKPYPTDEVNGAFHKPFYLLFDLALGGNMSGIKPADSDLPMDMQVDWVKVYSNVPDAKYRNEFNEDRTHYYDSNGEMLKDTTIALGNTAYNIDSNGLVTQA